VREALSLAAAELLDACRARRLMTDFGAGDGSPEAGLTGALEAMAAFAGTADGGADSGTLEGFFRVSELLNGLWNSFEGALDVYRDALADVASGSAGPSMPGISDALGLGSGEFVTFCRRRVRAWTEAAERLHVRALDRVSALDTLAAAKRLMAALVEVATPLISSTDARTLSELAKSLSALPGGGPGWEGDAPLASDLLTLLARFPKPLRREDLEPLENDFSVAFHRKLRDGLFDSALEAAGPAPAAAGGTGLSGVALSDAQLSDAALSETALSGAALSETRPSDPALSGAALPEPALSGAVLSEAELSGLVLSEAELAAEDPWTAGPGGPDGYLGPDGIFGPGWNLGPDGYYGLDFYVGPDGRYRPGAGTASASGAAEAAPGPVTITVGTWIDPAELAGEGDAGLSADGEPRFELRAAEEPEEAPEPTPAELAERSALAALEEESAPYSHRTDPFREFWGLTASGIAALVRERFPDLLAANVPPDPDFALPGGALPGGPGPGIGSSGPAIGSSGQAPGSPGGGTDAGVTGPDARDLTAAGFEDFRRRPSSGPGLPEPGPAEDGGSPDGEPAGGGDGAAPGAEEDDGASAFASERSSLAAAIMAQAAAAGALVPTATEAERARHRDFRRHLSALCRRLAGDGDTRPLYWLSVTAPRGVFPPELARLLHHGVHFRPYPAAAREAFSAAMAAAADAASDPAGAARDPEPALFAYASLARAGASCADPDLAPALDSLGPALPPRLRGGFLEALVDLNLRAGGEGVVKALRRMSDDRDKDRRQAVLKAMTDKFLEDMPKRSTSYVPANTVWKNLITSGGVLFGLLERCMAGGDVKALRAEAEELREPARVRELVNLYDRRSGRKDEISAAAFTAIAFYCGLTADLCREWLDFHGAGDQEGRGGWTLELINEVFSEAEKTVRLLPEPAAPDRPDAPDAAGDGSGAAGGGAAGNSPAAASAGNASAAGAAGEPAAASGDGPRGFGADVPDPSGPWDADSLPADAARLLLSALSDIASGTFMDCWDRERGSVSDPEGYHAADPGADLASWLVLCPGASSAGGSPAAPLAGIVEAVASGPWDRAGEDRAFHERVSEGEAVVPALFLEVVGGAGDRMDEGGRSFREILGELSRSKIDEAESFAEEAGETIAGLATSGALDPLAAAALGKEAEAALDAVLAAAPEADARAAAAAAAAAADAAARAREQARLSCGTVRSRVERLREQDVPFPGYVQKAVTSLLDDGELDAASDLVTEHVHRHLTGAQPMKLPDPAARSRTQDFFQALPELKGSPDVFAAARDLWAASRASRGLRAPAAGQAERIWDDIRQCVAEDAGEQETAAALEKLVRWLDFGTQKGAKAVPGHWGGGSFPWREFGMDATCEPPLPAWGTGQLRALSLLVWQGDGASPGHLMEALDEWNPPAGTAPVAIALSPVTTGVRGLVWGWARENRRDIALLDPALMASIAAAAPTARAPRLEWLFSAGGVYGAYRPYERTVPSLRSSGRDGGGALADRISEFEGVMRLEGPPGSGKSSMIGLALENPAVSKPSDGNWAAAVDWRSVPEEEIAGRGPVASALARAASDLALPGWDLSGDVRANLSALDAARGRKGFPSQFTVMVDNADGMIERVLADRRDLELLLDLARPGRVARLLLAGRKLSVLLERHPSSPLAALPEPEPAGPAEADGLWETLCGPLVPMGWVFENPTLPYRVMARAFWNHGALAVLAKRVLAEAERDSPPDGPPPFRITERAVARAVSDPETDRELASVCESAAPGPRHRALCLVAAYMGHAEETFYPGSGLPAEKLLQNLRDFWPAAFRDADLLEIRHLCSELCDAGLMARDPMGPRLRTAAVQRLMGDQDRILEELSALKDLPAPPDSQALACRRLLPAPGDADWADGWGDGARDGSGDGSGAGGSGARVGNGDGSGNGRDGGDSWRSLLPVPWSPETAAVEISGLPSWVPEALGPPALASAILGLSRLPLPGSQQEARPAEPRRPRGRPRKHPLPPAARSDANGGTVHGIGIPLPPPQRVVPEVLPAPSPLTLLQEAELFGRGGAAFTVITGSPASGGSRAGDALASLCAAEHRSGASASAIFAVRGQGSCSTRAGVRRLFDQTAERAGPDGETRIVADATGSPGPGGAQVFDALAQIARSRGRRDGTGSVRAAYLCGPEEALARRVRKGGPAGGGRGGPVPAPEPGYLPRWTEGAVGLYLAECGLDADLARGILDITGGWDALVLAEVHSLAGRSFGGAPNPESEGGSAPLELSGLVGDLRVMGPVTVPEAEALYPGLDGDARAELAGLMGMLAGLTVLVPAGERDGETVWALDPRLS
jgi:hypothetical protein